MAFLYLHLCFLLLFLSPSCIAQTNRNISSGEKPFTAKLHTASWVSSPSGEFAFGFYRLPDMPLFLPAIWFDQIPEKTVVWFANLTNPVQKGSTIELTNDGRLVLYDHQRNEAWRAEADGSAISASVLDTGDFVLEGADFQIIWRSFQEPTDTLLPTQELEMGGQLLSRLTDTNYSKGRFQLRLLRDGNLVLNTISSLDSDYAYDAYYISNTFGRGLKVVFNQSGYLNIVLRNNEGMQVLTPTDMFSPSEFYHRAILEPDGVFRQYIYPKPSSSTVGWNQAWSVVGSLPADICSVTPAKFGSGICGFNSYCELDMRQRPVCKCPPGYTYLDQKYTFYGCKQDFEQQSCESDGLDDEKQFELKEMININWPLFDYECLSPANEDECRGHCMNDCFCAVAIFSGTACWKKKMPLSNGRQDIGAKALIKVSNRNYSSNSSLFAQDVRRRERDRSRTILVGSLLLGSSLFLNFLFLSAMSIAAFFLCNRRELKYKAELSSLDMNIRSFTYKELEHVTDGFKNILGSGAFGIVYKGVIESDAGNFVAVKKLNKLEKEGEDEFRTEAMAISQTHHMNLVHLIGICEEGSHRLLVYEFMRNGSLASFIFGSPKPDWYQRKQIVLGIARGLMYLHEECSTQIIHCDIKPQNILLDDSFTARISDFGLAKLLKADQTRTNTSIRGTKGYVAPEWFKKTAITAKVDVYSFGVVLLEIICCRKHLESVPENREDAILMDWAWDCYRERRLDLLMEDGRDAFSDARRLERFVMVALWCIQEDPSLRPIMKTVTQMLEGAIEVAVPPDPFSISSLG